MVKRAPSKVKTSSNNVTRQSNVSKKQIKKEDDLSSQAVTYKDIKFQGSVDRNPRHLDSEQFRQTGATFTQIDTTMGDGSRINLLNQSSSQKHMAVERPVILNHTRKLPTQGTNREHKNP
jgi:hypothetical protein